MREKQKEAEETAKIKAKADLKVNRGNASKAASDDSDAEIEPESKKLVQAYFDIVEPSLINHVIQTFIMALIWGFGAPLLVPARDNYSAFVQGLLKRHFLDNCDFKFKKRVKQECFPQSTQNLFNVFYNLDIKMWLDWDHDIDKYDICGDIAADKRTSGLPEESDDAQPTSPRSPRNISDLDDLTKIEYSNLNIVT